MTIPNLLIKSQSTLYLHLCVWGGENYSYIRMEENFSANKRIARNSIFLSIRMVIVLAINLYTTRAVLSLLGVSDYGVFNVVCGFVTMFAFLNTSMSNGIVRFFNFELGKNGTDGALKVFNTSLYIQFFLAIFIIVVSETFGLWYLENKMIINPERMHAAHCIFHFSVSSFFFIILQAPFTAAVLAHERMDYFAIVNVIDAILKLLIVFLTPMFKTDNLIIYGALFALISVIDFALYFIYCICNFNEIQFKRRFHKELFNSMLVFSGWNMFGSLSGVMKDQGINIVLNSFFGTIVNAAMGVAAQVNSGLQSFVQNLSVPVRPQVIQSYARGDIERTMSLTYSISKFSCLFLYFISLPILIEIDFILNLWLKGNVPENSSTFVLIIVVTSFFSNLNQAVSGVVHASGRMRLYQIAGGMTGILAVPIAYIVLYYGGKPETALLVSLLSMIIAQINALLILKRIVKYSIRHYLKKVILPLMIVIATTIFFPIGIRLILESSVIRFLITVIVSFSVTIISIMLFGLDHNEKKMINQIFNKVINK